jgi:hypothetical protein
MTEPKNETKATAAEVNALDEAAKAEAVAKRTAYEKRMQNMQRTVEELAYVDDVLAVHGLTISDLLRSVAKNFHGVSIPLYVAPAEED